MMFVSIYGSLWYYYLLDIVTYIMLLPGIIFAVWAQIRVKTTFDKYSRVQTQRQVSGREAASIILNSAGVSGVAVVPCSGSLTDNYNPSNQTLNLSESTFSNTSVAAVGVAAHEAGHAVQHAENYLPLTIRSALVKVTNIGSFVALPLALLGVFVEWLAESTGGFGTILIAVGILCYSLSALFALVTLPVEINASRRAKKYLLSTGTLTRDEANAAGKVLYAAALTYVASLTMSLLYLLRFIVIISSMRRNRK